MTVENKMRVLISGAGPAGLTLAYWLEHYGHEAIIVEKSARIRTEGYMIDFTGTGWDVAKRMGLIPAIRERAYPTESVIYKDAQDKVTAQISVLDLLSSTGNDANFAALNRRDLVLSLYEAVQDKVAICFGKSIDTIHQDAEGVDVTFDDGSRGRYDLLIGCDGIHSQTRRMIFGDEQQFTHHLGYQFAIFQIAPLKYDLGDSYHMHVEPNLQVAVYPTEADKWLVFVIFKEANPYVPPQQERVQALKRRIEHLRWYVPEIMDSLQEDDYVFWDTITQIQMPRWYDNRVGILGDAAYCPTLISGQGASMAMAGAYFLAQALHQTNDYQQAFQMMDTRLRPHIEKIQRSAQNFATTFIPKSRWRIMLINWVLRFSNIPMFRGIVGKQFTINSIL